MDNKIFSKFNVYDQIGYLLVGGVGLLVVSINFYLLGKTNVMPEFNTQTFIVWFIIAYFLGHVFQAIANILIKEDKSEFNDSEKEILKKAKEYFGVEKQAWNETYLLCYMLASAKDITGQVQAFNAYYSLYRGWFVIFALNSVFVLIFNILNWFNFVIFIVLVISIFLSWLFYKRLKRFYNYSKGKTLQTFIILSKDKF